MFSFTIISFRTLGTRRSFDSEYRHSNGKELLSKFQFNESKNNSNKKNNSNDYESIENNNGNTNYYEDDYNMRKKEGRKTLWCRMQEKNANNSIKNIMDPTVSWKDIKLFLSYPCSERSSVTNSSSSKFVICSTNYNNSDNNDNYGNIGNNDGNNVNYNNKNNANTKMKKKLMNINLLPDAIRIGIDIQNDLNNFEIKNQEDNDKHQSLISHFLKNENNHNIDNNKSYRTDNGFNSNLIMMQSLPIGRGTRTILSTKSDSEFRGKNREENENLRDAIKSKSVNLNFETLESKNKKNSHFEKNLSEKTKKQQKIKISNISKKMLPLIRGMKKCDAKKIFDQEYLLPDMNDWNKELATISQ